MKNLTCIGLLAAVLVIAGCAKPAVKPETSGTTQVPADGAQSSGDNSAANAGSVGGEGAGSGPSGELLSRRIIYFDFDSAEIRADSQSIVAAHGKYLVDSPATRIRLEGHADERGSREYNIGLGERRAQAVRRALLLQGVSEVQLTTVSYGEERPAVAGSDDDAYSQNRRVEVVYAQ
jgi:peptidoglycan-associated lipoprotein